MTEIEFAKNIYVSRRLSTHTVELWWRTSSIRGPLADFGRVTGTTINIGVSGGTVLRHPSEVRVSFLSLSFFFRRVPL